MKAPDTKVPRLAHASSRPSERAAVPPIVLPIARRGVPLTDRLCWVIFGAAAIASAGLILWLNRDTTFNVDELAGVYAAPTLGLADVIEPYNDNLVATSRVVYKAALEAIGPEYLTFRILGAAAVILSAALFFALVKRRVGAVPALAPTFVLLLFGSAWPVVVVPIGFNLMLAVAAGLGALLALERDDRRGDIAACALLAFAVVTFSTGLPFVVGVAIAVMLRPDRWRRAWIFVIPLALYGGWWLWALSSAGSSGGEATLSNVLLVPNYLADSLAAVTAALTGLNYDFDGGDPFFVDDLGWGRVLAVVAVVALGLRILRGGVPSSLWASLGIVLSYWALGALAMGFLHPPLAARYLYLGAVGVLLVATDAARAQRFSKLGVAALFAVAAFSLATNIALLRDGAGHYRAQHANPARAQFAMLELARDRVDADFDAAVAVPDHAPVRGTSAEYFAVVDRYGSLAFSLAELERQSEGVRRGADRVLASALDVDLESSSPRQPAGECRRLRSGEREGVIDFELPPGGASLQAQGTGPAAVTLGRFASPAVDVGTASPGRRATLAVPPDALDRPWLASVTPARSVTVCALD